MELLFLEEVESTNKYAKEHIKHLSDKTVIYTFNQTAGRGRLNRSWNFMGKDNIYASIVLKPSDDLKEIYANLTQFLCVVLAQTFEEYGVEPKIKWPNDILINSKKISGILAESIFEKKLEGIIIGFGVNLNTKKELLEKINQPATSLNIETNKKIDTPKFLEKVLEKFCLMYDSFIENGFISIKEDYKKRANFLNKEIAVRIFDKTINGIAKDLTNNGALKIVDKQNIEHVLLIGDIL